MPEIPTESLLTETETSSTKSALADDEIPSETQPFDSKTYENLFDITSSISRSRLPFPDVSKKFYLREGRRWARNKTGNRDCDPTPMKTSKEGLNVAVKLKESIVLSTREAALLYNSEKNRILNIQDTQSSYRASDTYKILSKYLNVAQLYIFGVAYLFEAHGRDLNQISQAIFSLLSRFRDRMNNEKALLALAPSYRIVQQLLTTKCDRDTFDVLLSKVTSKGTVLKLRGTK